MFKIIGKVIFLFVFINLSNISNSYSAKDKSKDKSYEDLYNEFAVCAFGPDKNPASSYSKNEAKNQKKIINSCEKECKKDRKKMNRDCKKIAKSFKDRVKESKKGKSKLISLDQLNTDYLACIEKGNPVKFCMEKCEANGKEYKKECKRIKKGQNYTLKLDWKEIKDQCLSGKEPFDDKKTATVCCQNLNRRAIEKGVAYGIVAAAAVTAGGVVVANALAANALAASSAAVVAAEGSATTAATALSAAGTAATTVEKTKRLAEAKEKADQAHKAALEANEKLNAEDTKAIYKAKVGATNAVKNLSDQQMADIEKKCMTGAKNCLSKIQGYAPDPNNVQEKGKMAKLIRKLIPELNRMEMYKCDQLLKK